jgi:hypothetical protein
LYNFDEKAYLYNVFKKTKEYKYSKYSYDGRYFLNSLSQVGIDEKKYKEKKQEALDSLSEDQQKTNKTIIALSRLVDYIREIKPDLTIKELIEVAKLPIGYQYLRNVLSRAKTETEHEDFKEVKTLKLVMPHEAKIEK